MKNFKIIAVTVIVSGALFIAGSAYAAFVMCGSESGSCTSGVVAPTKTPEQQAQDTKNAQTNTQLQQTPDYDPTTNAMLLNMENRIAKLEARISVLEAKQGVTTNVTPTPSCPSISDQIAKGYIFNICNGQKL